MKPYQVTIALSVISGRCPAVNLSFGERQALFGLSLLGPEATRVSAEIVEQAEKVIAAQLLEHQILADAAQQYGGIVSKLDLDAIVNAARQEPSADDVAALKSLLKSNQEIVDRLIAWHTRWAHIHDLNESGGGGVPELIGLVSDARCVASHKAK